MQLSEGTQLGAYETISPLGAGGMGEVYRAKDPRLDREVAIKILPDLLSKDPERVARFQREAKVLATLSHQNIAGIHGFEDSGQTRFIVLELVEGQTLADLLRAGPIQVVDALEMCMQVAEAVEAAHETNVVHRDLKPANIKVSPQGKVKVLDFGLAKALADEPSSGYDSANSPTITAQHTQQGVILGTASYMSPEQARGKPVDKRSDIWSFGCVLFECLAGSRAFGGETTSDISAKILEGQPDWPALPETVPANIRILLQRCLEKDPRQRLHDIADARIEINAVLDPSRTALTHVDPIAAPPKRQRIALPWGLAAMLAIGAAWLGVRNWRLPTPTQRVVSRSVIELATDTSLVIADNRSLAISPDGTRVVYLGERGNRVQLYLRPLDRFNAEPIRGTENGNGPFFSPDGQWVAYFDYAAGKLKKAPLPGGGAVDICDAPPSSRGGSWAANGSIVFTRGISGGLYTVAENGGPVQALAIPDVDKGEKSYRLPQFLPGGGAVLFTISKSDISSYDDAQIAVVSLDTGQVTVVCKGGANPRYLPSGHLVYARAGSLVARPFDVNRLEVTGPPIEVLKGVVTSDAYGSAQFGLSYTGSLVYASGGPELYYNRLILVDRDGQAHPLPANADLFNAARWSPDGKRLVLQVSAGNDNLWIYNVSRGTLSRLTTGGGDSYWPVWTPDGQRVAFASNRKGTNDIYWMPADRSGAGELLMDHQYDVTPMAFTPDGKHLIFTQHEPATLSDIWMRSVADGEPQRLVGTSFEEADAVLSPDGRYMAYTSNETSRPEVYVQAFPDGGRRWLISTGGGDLPVWGRDPDNLELYYRNANRLMVVGVQTDPNFSAESPEMLLEFADPLNLLSNGYDVSPDGKQFVMIEEGTQDSAPTQLRLVTNWFEELRTRVPIGE